MENLDKYTFSTKNGQLLSTQPFPNGNMLRSTAELLFLVTKNPLDYRKYRKGIDDCYIVGEGLFSRYPDRAENTSVDDLLVLGTDSIYASLILDVSRKNIGFYSVDGKWSWNQFIPRFLGLWQHLRISAKENVGIIGQLIWAGSLILAAHQPVENEDNWLLSHLMVLTYEKSGFSSKICDLAIKYWKFKKPLESWKIMSAYLGPQCADHPLIEAWKPYD